MGNLQDLRNEVADALALIKLDIFRRPAKVTPRLTRIGSELKSEGRTVRSVGPNAYWLALNDNVLDNGLPTYPSKSTIDATLDAAVAMGANTIRVHSIGISLGKPKTIMPTLDTYDPIAFDVADYVIASAKARGLWLSVPLTDRWDYYHGGAQSLVNMVMPSGSRQLWRFWAESSVRAAFDRYVSVLLNHVNPYTGLRWGDDPTLAMWEVANEFYDLRNEQSSRDRHASAAALIKSLAPRALVVDGTGASGGRISDAPGLTDANIDIVTGHYYNDHSMDLNWLPGDAESAVNAGKVFMVGEYDWTDGGNGQVDQNTSVTRAQWLSAMENNRRVAGDFWWTLLVPAAGVHRDRYELYVPTENAEQAAGLIALTAHAQLMKAPAPSQVEMGYAESGNTESATQPNSPSFLSLPIAPSPDDGLLVTSDLFVQCQGTAGTQFIAALWVDGVEVVRSLQMTAPSGPNVIRLSKRIPSSPVAREVSVRYGPLTAGVQVDLVANGPGNYYNTLRVTR